MRLDAGDRDHLRPRRRCRAFRAAATGGSCGDLAEQRAEAAAEPRGRFFGMASLMRPSLSCGQRPISFARECHIGVRARAAMIVDQRRQAVARRFGQADVARDHRFEHELAEAGAHVVGDLVGQAVAAVEHGQRDAEDRQVRD